MMLMIYDGLLRLYPAAFRARFGAEMREIFQMRLAEAGSRWLLLWIVGRELRQLPGNLIEAHSYHRARQQHTDPDTVLARWVVRLGGLGIGGFFLFVSFAFPAPLWMKIGMLLLVGSLLVEWRWQQVGGRLIIVTACALIGFNTLTAASLLLMGLALISTSLIALPFLMFGWFSLYIGKQGVTVSS